MLSFLKYVNDIQSRSTSNVKPESHFIAVVTQLTRAIPTLHLTPLQVKMDLRMIANAKQINRNMVDGIKILKVDVFHHRAIINSIVSKLRVEISPALYSKGFQGTVRPRSR